MNVRHNLSSLLKAAVAVTVVGGVLTAVDAHHTPAVVAPIAVVRPAATGSTAVQCGPGGVIIPAGNEVCAAASTLPAVVPSLDRSTGVPFCLVSPDSDACSGNPSTDLH